MIAPSDYYEQSVKLGQQFQQHNPKNWAGNDSKSYHNNIRFLMDRYAARTVLDYGCGKGQQYTDVVPYGLPHGVISEPMTFQTRINAESVYKYDPCVPAFDQEPVGQQFDAVICTQVLGGIPDADMPWVKDKLMMYATKFVFIGLHSSPGKSKKRIYNPAYVTPNRTLEWYQAQFDNWTGPDLYWWFRYSDTRCNDWYKT